MAEDPAQLSLRFNCWLILQRRSLNYYQYHSKSPYFWALSYSLCSLILTECERLPWCEFSANFTFPGRQNSSTNVVYLYSASTIYAELHIPYASQSEVECLSSNWKYLTLDRECFHFLEIVNSMENQFLQDRGEHPCCQMLFEKFFVNNSFWLYSPLSKSSISTLARPLNVH